MTWNIEAMRKRIHEQAGSWIEIETEDGDVYRVPERAMACYALNRTAGRHLMPDWQPVSRPGMKMQMDDRYHTDCVIAAGFGPDEWRGSFTPSRAQEAYKAFDDAIRAKRFDVQNELVGFENEVLHDAGFVSGVAIWPEINHEDTYEDADARVLVLEDGSPENTVYLSDKVEGIVMQTGGKLVHLAQVAAEQGITVMRDPDARDRILPAAYVKLAPHRGTIELGTIKSGFHTKRVDGSRRRSISWGKSLLEEGAP